MDVVHWVRQVEMLTAANNWTEQQQVCNAVAAMTGSASYWLDSASVNTWQELKEQMLHRFGQNVETIANKLYTCTQANRESIDQYIDRFRQLAAKLSASGNPLSDALLLSIFIKGVRKDLRRELIIKHPHTLEEAISDAKYMDENLQPEHDYATNASNGRNNGRFQPDNRPQRHEPNAYQGPKPNQNEPRPPRPMPQQNQQPKTWPPRGHRNRVEEDVDNINRQMEKLQLQKAALQKSGQAMQYTGRMIGTHKDCYYDDGDIEMTDASIYTNYYTPPDYEAPYYWNAYEGDVEMRDAAPIAPRRPRQRQAFNPSSLPRRPAQEPQRPPPDFQRRAAPPAAQPPHSGPRAQGAPQGMPPIPPPARRTTRTAQNFHISEQLQSTGAKISIAELIRLAPEVRTELKRMLERVEQEQEPHGQQHYTHDIMESQCITEPRDNYQHQRYDATTLGESAGGISVVKATVRLANADVNAIIDSGASHTMISEVLARKLQLYKDIVPTQAKFYTSSGKLERPVGRLLDVPITVGDLTLPVDIYVSPARTYSLLLGNNYLAAVEAQINFGTRELIYRKDLNTYEAIPIEYVEHAGDQAGKVQMSCTARFGKGKENIWLSQLIQPPTFEELTEEDDPTYDSTVASEGETEDEAEEEVKKEDQEQQEANEDRESWDLGYDNEDDVWQGLLSTTTSETDSLSISSSVVYSKEKSLTLHEQTDHLIGIFEEMHSHIINESATELRTKIRDTDDWCFDHSKFQEYHLKYGPFDVEACADEEGHNAHMSPYWSAKDSCLQHSWTGLRTYCNPPWRLIDPILEHFLSCRREDPTGTHALFILPNWPWQSWYPTVMQHFEIVDYFPTGSQLFTAPNAVGEEQHTRAILGPTRWPIMVVHSTHDKAANGQDWSMKFRPPLSKAVEQHIPEGMEARDLANWRLGEKLTEEMKTQLQQLMNENVEIWAWKEGDIGRTHVYAHAIDTGGALPLKQRAYRLSSAEDEIVDREVEKWLAAGIVVESASPWASPVVLVQKKKLDPTDAEEKPKFRLCIDYRKLNSVTKADSFPLPIIQDALDSLGTSQHFSIIDLRSAFLQLPLHPNDREKTAFVTKQGLFEFTVLPFGLKNSPSIFQRLMSEVLRGLIGNTCMVFLDDIIVFSRTWEEHIQHLQEVFARLRDHNLHAHPEKSVIGTHELLYLGHIINAEGNQPDPNKIAAVAKIQPPTDTTNLRAFLGLIGYYRRFIPHFAARAAPLHQLLRKDQHYYWNEQCQTAFEDLRQALMEPPVLRRPAPGGQYILQTDWSSTAIAAVLCQKLDDKEHPVAYASKALTSAERNYAATEGECLAVVWACKYFRQYLWGQHFTLQTDHAALKWLMETRDVTAKLARWALKLQEYDFEIQYRPGKANANADGLSRLPMERCDDCDLVIIVCTADFDDDDVDVDVDDLETAEASRKRRRSTATSKGGEEITRTQPKLTPQTLGDHTHGAQQHLKAARPWERPHVQKAIREYNSSGTPEDCRKTFDEKYETLFGAGDNRSDSIDPGMTCELCKDPGNDAVMLVCQSCSRGFHTFCLEPRLNSIPTANWYCGDCGGDAARTTHFKDITEDANVLHFLANDRSVDSSWSKLEQNRVRKRAANYFMDGREELYRAATKKLPARPVCDKGDREKVIANAHSFGHWNPLRTAALISENYYWGGIVQDCKDFIRDCHECKLEKAHFSKPQELQSIPVTDHSFHRVGVDLVGPLPKSKAGNKYIVVAMDYLSKWPEAHAIPDKTSKTVANFFLKDVIARHGCPKEVLTDNGGEFLGHFDSLLQQYHIDHRFTSANHPQANGLVERFNGTLCTALRKCAAQDIDDWDTHIPTVLLGYRSTVQASTKFTPFFMLYARQPLLPLGSNSSTLDLEGTAIEQAADIILSSNDIPILDPILTEEAAHITLEKAKTRDRAAITAVENIGKAQEKQRRDYRGKRKYVEPTTMKAGDYVVIKGSSRKGKLEHAALPEVYQLMEFTNEQKNVAIIRDDSSPPQRWRENVSNLAIYTDLTTNTQEEGEIAP